MVKRELIEKLKAHALIQHWEDLAAISRESVRLHLLVEDDDTIPLGRSKMGGQPDLPLDCPWPTSSDEQKPLAFLAQLNLTEISASDSQNLLPKQGILYFFYEAEEQPWGYTSTDKELFRVFYHDCAPNDLQRAAFPDALSEYSFFESCTLIPQQEISVPSDFTRLPFLTEEEHDIFLDHITEGGNINKMFGYADTVQGEMELQCALVTNNLYCGDSSDYNDPRAKALEPQAADWRLLLQVDSNEEECAMQWGDGGRLYFWIREQDLRNLNFDNCWCILQCY